MKTIKMYCVSCEKNAVNKNSSVGRTEQNRLMLVSKCVVCGKKISRFIKNQEASRLELQFDNCFVLITFEMISSK